MKSISKIMLPPIVLICILLSVENSIVLSLVFVIIHEFSHILVARMLQSNFKNIEIHIYGLSVELMDLDELTDKERILIYIAGPLVNLLIALIFFLFNKDITNINKIIEINLGLAIFNLLPAYPLDGARLLEILLSQRVIYKRTHTIISNISYCLAGLFITVSMITPFVIGKYNISLTIAGIIIICITRKESKAKMYIIMGNIFKKRRSLMRNKYLENKSISVYIKEDLANIMALVDKNRFNIFYILDDDMKVKYIINEDELIEALKKYGNITAEEYYNVTKMNSE